MSRRTPVREVQSTINVDSPVRRSTRLQTSTSSPAPSSISSRRSSASSDSLKDKSLETGLTKKNINLRRASASSEEVSSSSTIAPTRKTRTSLSLNNSEDITKSKEKVQELEPLENASSTPARKSVRLRAASTSPSSIINIEQSSTPNKPVTRRRRSSSSAIEEDTKSVTAPLTRVRRSSSDTKLNNEEKGELKPKPKTRRSSLSKEDGEVKLTPIKTKRRLSVAEETTLESIEEKDSPEKNDEQPAHVSNRKKEDVKSNLDLSIIDELEEKTGNSPKKIETTKTLEMTENLENTDSGSTSLKKIKLDESSNTSKEIKNAQSPFKKRFMANGEESKKTVESLEEHLLNPDVTTDNSSSANKVLETSVTDESFSLNLSSSQFETTQFPNTAESVAETKDSSPGSDKENSAGNVLKLNPKVLEEVKDKRVSNVWAPKGRKSFSFCEPMEVDETIKSPTEVFESQTESPVLNKTQKSLSVKEIVLEPSPDVSIDKSVTLSSHAKIIDGTNAVEGQDFAKKTLEDGKVLKEEHLKTSTKKIDISEKLCDPATELPPKKLATENEKSVRNKETIEENMLSTAETTAVNETDKSILIRQSPRVSKSSQDTDKQDSSLNETEIGLLKGLQSNALNDTTQSEVFLPEGLDKKADENTNCQNKEAKVLEDAKVSSENIGEVNQDSSFTNLNEKLVEVSQSESEKESEEMVEDSEVELRRVLEESMINDSIGHDDSKDINKVEESPKLNKSNKKSTESLINLSGLDEFAVSFSMDSSTESNLQKDTSLIGTVKTIDTSKIVKEVIVDTDNLKEDSVECKIDTNSKNTRNSKRLSESKTLLNEIKKKELASPIENKESHSSEKSNPSSKKLNIEGVNLQKEAESPSPRRSSRLSVKSENSKQNVLSNEATSINTSDSDTLPEDITDTDSEISFKKEFIKVKMPFPKKSKNTSVELSDEANSSQDNISVDQNQTNEESTDEIRSKPGNKIDVGISSTSSKEEENVSDKNLSEENSSVLKELKADKKIVSKNEDSNSSKRKSIPKQQRKGDDKFDEKVNENQKVALLDKKSPDEHSLKEINEDQIISSSKNDETKSNERVSVLKHQKEEDKSKEESVEKNQKDKLDLSVHFDSDSEEETLENQLLVDVGKSNVGQHFSTPKAKLNKDIDYRLDLLLSKSLGDDSSSDDEDFKVEDGDANETSLSDEIVEETEDSSTTGNEFLDDMASEGKEDTPSEGSNDIIDHGETTSPAESESGEEEETFLDDSFIDDGPTEELLSGEEYDLEIDEELESINTSGSILTTKRGSTKSVAKNRIRILKNVDSSEDESENGKKQDRNVSVRKRSRIIEPTESNSDVDQTGNEITEDSGTIKSGNQESPKKVIEPKNTSDIEVKENAEILANTTKVNEDEGKQSPKKRCRRSASTSENIELEEQSIVEEDTESNSKRLKNDEPKSLVQSKDFSDSLMNRRRFSYNSSSAQGSPNSSLVDVFNTSRRSSSSKRSSIVVHENVSVDQIQDSVLSEKIQQVVQIFCAGIKSKGNVSLNVSLDYTESNSEKNTAKSIKDEDNDDVVYMGEVDDEVPTTSKTQEERMNEESVQKKKKNKKRRESLNKSLSQNELAEDEESAQKNKKNKKHKESLTLSLPQNELTDDEEEMSPKKKKNKRENEESDLNESKGHLNRQKSKTKLFASQSLLEMNQKKAKQTELHNEEKGDVVQRHEDETEVKKPTKVSKKAKRGKNEKSTDTNQPRRSLENTVQQLEHVKKNSLKKTKGKPISDLKKKMELALQDGLIDVKNRLKRKIKPSDSHTNSGWSTEVIRDAKPSTANVVIKKDVDDKFDSQKIGPKDFRNQMIYDASRNKRTDSKRVFKKKGIL